ncbi:MAG: glycosyltransferase family 39 protein [Polyangiales bacterium]
MARESPGSTWLVYAAFALVLGAQVFLGLWGVADQWTRGHNGWNGAAYQNGARNTLRWGTLFPLQYGTDNVPPKEEALYTHAPLGLHLHLVAATRLLGDHEATVRGVAAFWSIAVVCALFFVVRRFWGDSEAVLAAAIYVALPINAIYMNMANHSAGFLFWGLVALALYVSSDDDRGWRRGTFAAFLGAIAMGAAWDWPAYYVAFAIAVHWALREWREQHQFSWRLVAFCVWVASLFLVHLALVYESTGSLDELTSTFNARRALSGTRFRTHLLVVPPLMFTWPLLSVAAGWLLISGLRTLRGVGRPRDVIPIAFLFAALVHYGTFRWSAVVHSYWAWPALPYVAITVSVSILATARALGGTAATRIAAVAIAACVLIPLAVRDGAMVAEGRHVGGSMWFFTPVRGAIDTYDSGRPELRLAELVRERTDRATGVQLHPGFKSRRLEPRFDITLDRATYRWSPRPRERIDNRQGVDGWVFLAPIAEVAEEERIALASRHPYREFDAYFMADLRREGVDVEIWKSVSTPATVGWRLLHSPRESPVRMSRSRTKEDDLRARIAAQEGKRE